MLNAFACLINFVEKSVPISFLSGMVRWLFPSEDNRVRKIVALVPFVIILPFIIPRQVSAEVIGVLMPAKDVPQYMRMHHAMVQEFATMGESHEVILQMPAASQLAWRNAVRKFDVLGSRVMVTYGSALSALVVGEKPQTPVIYGGAYAPVACGVIGNVTGMDATFPLEELLGTLKKITNYSTLAIFYSSTEADSVRQMEDAETIVLKTGAGVVKIDTHDVNFLDQAGKDVVFDSDFFNLSGAEAVLLTMAGNINTKNNISLIARSCLVNRKATASVLSGTCELGVLLSYAVNPEEQGKGIAGKVLEIMKGKSPGDIPPDTAPKIEMSFNLNTAKTLGLSVPFELLGTAKIVK